MIIYVRIKQDNICKSLSTVPKKRTDIQQIVGVTNNTGFVKRDHTNIPNLVPDILLNKIQNFL